MRFEWKQKGRLTDQSPLVKVAIRRPFQLLASNLPNALGLRTPGREAKTGILLVFLFAFVNRAGIAARRIDLSRDRAVLGVES